MRFKRVFVAGIVAAASIALSRSADAAPQGVEIVESVATSAPQVSSSAPVTAPVRTAAGPPTIPAARASSVVSIDGRLDDAAWRNATRITEFVQMSPVEGAGATEQTEVLVAYDSETIYFGFYAHYSDVSLLRANRVDRDRTERDDTIALYFDTFLDQQRAYVFTVNGYGVPADAVVSGVTGRPGGDAAVGEVPVSDPSWDALFYTAGRLVDDGWTAEMAIPFKSLRYPAKSEDQGHTWGFQIVRSIEGKNEKVVWAPVTRSIAGFMTQMGVLQGITNLSTRRNLELQPTFTVIQNGSLDTQTGVFSQNNSLAEGGVNAKFGITSNLTMDFTWNPDFSQIESDRPQIDVNQRYALRYPELRPFFLEGQEIFRLNEAASVNLVHTRTIVDPRYGAKVTGKVGRTAIGLIFAEDEAPGKRDDPTDPAFGQTAQFFIGRVRHDVYSDSYLGALYTDREFMSGHSRVSVLDGNFRLGQTINVGGMAGVSNYRSDNGIDQRSGMYYFARFEHAGRNLNIYTYQKDGSPDFRTDAGFIQHVDEHQFNLDNHQTQARVTYRWWPEGRIVNWGPTLGYKRDYDFEGRVQNTFWDANVEALFARNVSITVSASRDMELYRDVEFHKQGFALSADVRTSRRFSVGGRITRGDDIRYVANPFLGDGMGVSLNATLRPFSRLQSQINIDTKRLVLPDSHQRVFDIKIHRSLTTYQLTERMLVRNILEYNTFSKTAAANVTFTYRVNSGTALYVGWDDHFRQADQIDNLRYADMTDFRRTNRALFAKIQYLFRYHGS
jgi:hypothetical protein